MLDERRPDAGTWSPHNDVRLSARVEVALNAPLPGWPPPFDCTDDVLESLMEMPQTVRSLCFVMHYRRMHCRRSVAPLMAILAEIERCRSASDDNAASELTALARRGDETGFRALAACVMPLEEVGECWAGVRDRLGLPT